VSRLMRTGRGTVSSLLGFESSEVFIRLLPPVCLLPFPLFRLLLERWPTGSVWLSIRQRVSLRYLVAKPCVKARTASRCGPRSLLNHFYRTFYRVSHGSGHFGRLRHALHPSCVLPGHSWYQNLLPSVDLIRATCRVQQHMDP